VEERIILQKDLDRTNHLLPFDMIRTAQKTMHPTILLLLTVFVAMVASYQAVGLATMGVIFRQTAW
jgi:hypothetical protein